MRLLDRNILTGLCLVVFDESLVDRLVELARRIVGDVEKGGVGSEHSARRQRTENKRRAGGKGASNSHGSNLLCDNTRNSICLVVFIKRGPYHIFLPRHSASLKNVRSENCFRKPVPTLRFFGRKALRDRLDGCGFGVPRAGNSVGN